MSPDDIDSFSVDLHSFLINHFDCKIDEDNDYLREWTDEQKFKFIHKVNS